MVCYVQVLTMSSASSLSFSFTSCGVSCSSCWPSSWSREMMMMSTSLHTCTLTFPYMYIFPYKAVQSHVHTHTLYYSHWQSHWAGLHGVGQSLLHLCPLHPTSHPAPSAATDDHTPRPVEEGEAFRQTRQCHPLSPYYSSNVSYTYMDIAQWMNWSQILTTRTTIT